MFATLPPRAIGAPTEIHAEDYGPFIVRKAWERMHLELNVWSYPVMPESGLTDFEKQFIVDRLYRVWLQAREYPIVEFRTGDDPIFTLGPGEPPRTAVTGAWANDPIIFNLDAIRDPARFTFASAVGLIAHELGHKIDRGSPYDTSHARPVITQTMIDTVAAKITRAAQMRESRASLKGLGDERLELYTVNPYGWSQLGIATLPQTELPIVGMLQGSQIFALSDGVFRPALQSNENPNEPMRFENLTIEQFQPIRIPGSSDRLGFRVRTVARHRLNPKKGNTIYNSLYERLFETDFVYAQRPDGVIEEGPSQMISIGQIGTDVRVAPTLDREALSRRHFVVSGEIDLKTNSIGSVFASSIRALVEENGVLSLRRVELLEADEIPMSMPAEYTRFVFNLDLAAPGGTAASFAFLGLDVRMPYSGPVTYVPADRFYFAAERELRASF